MPASWKLGATVGQHTLLRELGQGGMGVVYLAQHQVSGAHHALKMLDLGAGPELRERFRREGLAQARVDAHPNVVRVHAAGEQAGRMYLVMDLAPGGDLNSRLGGKPLPLAEGAALVAALARGLDHVHGAGVLHRDLKPANVICDGAGVPKLVDFGLAFVSGEDRLTVTGEIMGTPSYMSPEQVRGDPALMDERTDVYGLGGVLYYVLTGQPPAGGATAINVFHQITHGKILPPSKHVPGLPADADLVCLKALARDPADRYQSAGAFADDLERLAAGEPVEALTGSSLRPWSVIFLGGVVLALAAGIFLTRESEAPVLPTLPIVAANRGRLLSDTSALTSSISTELTGRLPEGVRASRVRFGAATLPVLLDGRFAVTSTLREGENLLELEAIRGDQAVARATWQVTLDTTPPSLDLDPIAEGEIGRRGEPEVVAEHVRLTGRTSGARVRVGGVVATPAADGAFELSVALGGGKNVLRVVSEDEAGVSTSATCVVHRQLVISLSELADRSALRHDGGTRWIAAPGVVQVHEHERLVLPAGTRIAFETGARLTVRGTLISQGTKGNPVLLGGQGWSGVRVQGGSVELRYTTLEGASGEDGGGLNLLNGSRLEAEHCTFKGCHGGERGGGLYARNSSLRLTDVVFVGNRANEGGGAAIRGGKATLLRCTFRQNSATERAGALMVKGEKSVVELLGVRFEDNEAPQAGALLLWGTVGSALRDCVFTRNRATTSKPGPASGGGGIYARESNATTLEECSFGENTSATSGGGVKLLRSPVSLRNCEFTRNTATTSGGGLYSNTSSFRLEDTEFDSNQTGLATDAFGGGVGVTGEPVGRERTLVRCSFKGNRSSRGGGLSVQTRGRLVLEEVVFEANEAAISGGGLLTDSGIYELIRCRFLANRANSRAEGCRGGGAVFRGESQAKLRDCTFEDNRTSGWGGGVLATESALRLTGRNVFRNNQASVGGGLAIKDVGSTAPAEGRFVIRGALFEGNRAEANGGGARLHGFRLAQVEHCEFRGNTDAHGGGGLWVGHWYGPKDTGKEPTACFEFQGNVFAENTLGDVHLDRRLLRADTYEKNGLDRKRLRLSRPR